ncbi:MAG TPA: hypothetical protein VMY05_01130 [Acidobacteriota bacterium]|nr:hypothetical protein [Acidobacteriota bacterium]
MTKLSLSIAAFAILLAVQDLPAEDNSIELKHYRVLLTDGSRTEGRRGLLTSDGFEGVSLRGSHISIPGDEIWKLQRPGGTEARKGAMLGGALGVFTAFVVYLKTSADDTEGLFGESNRHMIVPLFGGCTAVGALIGVAFGSAVTAWENVPLEPVFGSRPGFGGNIPPGTGSVDVEKQPRHRGAAFLSFTGGSFRLSYPRIELLGVGYDYKDVYGSRDGLSYGGEAGIGVADIGLFLCVKYRTWKKSGTPVEIGLIDFDGTAVWKQSFLHIGLRHFLVDSTKRSRVLVPFVGGGIIHTDAEETIRGQVDYQGEQEYMDLTVQADGTGWYIEGGADLFVLRIVSIRAVVEYSKLAMGFAAEGSRYHIDGGGGVYAGVSVSWFFGRSMKSP